MSTAGVIEPVSTNSASGAAPNLDLSAGSVQDVTLTANATLTISNPPATGKGYGVTLILRQDATGSRTLTWPTSIKWAGGAAPVISTAANSIDVYTFYTTNGGVTWLGTQAGKGFA